MVWRPLHSCEKDASKKTTSNELGHMTGDQNSTRAHGLETLHMWEKDAAKKTIAIFFNPHMCQSSLFVYVARDI